MSRNSKRFGEPLAPAGFRPLYVRAWPTLTPPGLGLPCSQHLRPEHPDERFCRSRRIGGTMSQALSPLNLAHVWPTTGSKRSTEPLASHAGIGLGLARRAHPLAAVVACQAVLGNPR
jgi:hypothetical protein